MAQKRPHCSREDPNPGHKSSRTGFKEMPDQKTRLERLLREIPPQCEPRFLNYQLVGDLVSIMILESKDAFQYQLPRRPVISRNFADLRWKTHDLKSALKRTDPERHPIAKNVILSLGYNDCQKNKYGKHKLIDDIEKIIQRLRDKGCEEFIVTNVPPCANYAENVDHWRLLQFVNDEIQRICSKSEDLCHCDIFKLFCSKKGFFGADEYVTFGDINYELELKHYNVRSSKGDIDLITFSTAGKNKLRQFMEITIQKRITYLKSKIMNVDDKVICILEEDGDDSPVIEEIPAIGNSAATTEEIVISDDENDCVVIPVDDTAKVDIPSHSLECKCEDCRTKHNKLMEAMLSTLNCWKEDVEDNPKDVKKEETAIEKPSTPETTTEHRHKHKDKYKKVKDVSSEPIDVKNETFATIKKKEKRLEATVCQKEKILEEVKVEDLDKVDGETLNMLNIEALNQIKKKILVEVEKEILVELKDEGITEVKQEEIMLDENM